MIYDDLKKWLLEWIDSAGNVIVELNCEDMIIFDAILVISKQIDIIEATPISERKAKVTLNKMILVEIKEAIENGNHDISEYGWSN